MTIPVERTRAVAAARELLYELEDPYGLKRIPAAVRERARRVLRHYPFTSDLIESAAKLPAIWGRPE